MSLLSYRLFEIQVWWARRRRVVFAFALTAAAVLTLTWLFIGCSSVQVADDPEDSAAVTIGKRAARAAVLAGAASICRSLRPDDTTHPIAAQAWHSFCPPILKPAAGGTAEVDLSPAAPEP